MRIIFLLLLPVVSLSQDIIITSQTTGIIDAQGGSVGIQGVATNVTIKNAVILEPNKYRQIFDTSVYLENCRVREFSTAWYGAKRSRVDNYHELQKSITTCINNNIKNLYVADSYTYSYALKCSKLYNNEYIGFALNIYGDGDMWDDKTILTYTGNDFAIGFQRTKGGSIYNLKIVGNYVAPQNNGLTYYSTPFPVKQWHYGVICDYDGTRNIGGSTALKIHDLWVTGFDVLYCITPSPQMQNGDCITFENIRCGNGRIGVDIGNAQEKGNSITNIVAWDNLYTLIQIGNSVKLQAGDYVVRGGNIAGGVVQLFNLQMSGWNKFTVYGLYAESIARIGNIYAQTVQHQVPVVLDGMSVRFALKTQAGDQVLINSAAPRLKISNSNLWYYGQSGETMNFTGPVTFENCDFGASVWSSSAITSIDYSNSQVTIKRTQ